MPIYEHYRPGNHRIYQFYAKTLAQGASAGRGRAAGGTPGGAPRLRDRP